MVHFENIFQTSYPTNIDAVTEVVKGRVDNEMHEYLNKPFSKEEVLGALKQMKGLAAPGPDGWPSTIFYQRYLGHHW
jgi:CheY-like chemotaxis protein